MAAGELIITDRLTRCEFVPVLNQSARMGNAGQSAVAEFGPDLFRLLVETEQLDEASARNWKAWKLRRRGRAATFTAFDLWNANPRGHIDTQDGALSLNVVIDTSRVILYGVGAAATLKVGDMISYRTAANGYWIGYVQEDAAAQMPANLISVPVLPRPLAPHATAPAVRRVQALGEFEMTTDPAGFEPYSGRTLQFEGMQILR